MKLGVSTFVAGLLVASTIALSASAQEKRKGLVDQMSGQGYGMAGCGLGSILFGERPGAVQVFASTTNGIYYNNTFAASSGTSNCDLQEDSSVAVTRFIESNRLPMQNDVARGSGETLEAFYNIAGCQSEKDVSVVLQKNYQQIFKADANTEQVLSSIRTTLRGDHRTAHACLHLG